MQLKYKLLFGAVLSSMLVGTAIGATGGGTKSVTIVHTGDFHGHLAPRPNVRSDGDGRMEGGLARIYKEISKIRDDKGQIVLVHGGDTIQGSGEALYTMGDAMVSVMDNFGYDGYTPGNWDFVYGKDRFIELWGPGSAPNNTNRWGAVVANLYHTGVKKPGHEGAPDAPLNTTNKNSSQGENVSKAESEALANWYFEHGVRVANPTSDPTVVKIINGAKVGIIGCTTTRGPQVVGSWVSDGLSYTDCSIEVPFYAAKLRNEEKVDLVVLVSEIEIGRNIQLARTLAADAHVDVIFNSDMHEETLEPIKVTTAGGKTTLIIEEGMDGTMIGEITFQVKDKVVKSWDFVPHRIDDRIPEDKNIAAIVAAVRAPYNEGFDYTKAEACRNATSVAEVQGNPYVSPLSILGLTNPTEFLCLNGPLNQEVGNTDIALHRSNFSHEDMPAVIEGTSHDLIADAIRWWAQSDLATVRGFRYGTTIKPGPITRNDLFHYIPIAARVAKAGKVAANQLRNQIDNSSRAVLSSNPGDDRRVLPRYNNAYGDPNNVLSKSSPGAGLPAMGGAAAPEGWGGGWLFAYSADGFHMDFAPYFNALGWVYSTSGPGSADYNTVVLSPPNNFSRARGLTLKVLCKQLPPSEKVSTGCDVNDKSTRYTTVITEQNNGRYKLPWRETYGTGASTTATAYNSFLLNPDGWTYLQGIPNQPNNANAVNQHFKAGLFTVAGYWYPQSPNTLNNCNNCYPTGTVNGNVAANQTVSVDGAYGYNPDAAFLLPVNMKGDGTRSVDSNGMPIVETDGSGNLVWENGKPKVTGKPIQLTEIVEKYLASIGTVDSGNLKINRIGVVDNNGNAMSLPNTTSTLGFPTMQPLCGTLGQDSNNPATCP